MTSSANSWKLPFNLAVLSHVLILASAIILPKYLHKKPLIPEFLSVDLVNIAAPLPQTTQPSPAPPQIKQDIKPSSPPPAERKKTAPIVPIRATATKEVAPSPVEAISIQPLKRKVKVKIPKNTTTEINRQRDSERERQQLLEEARRQKALADAEAAAASNAVKALKQLLQADSVTSATQTNQPTTARSGGNSNSAIENQYIATIGSSLNQHWALPEIKPWNSDLSATVIIHIAKDGRIINHRFEKRSGDSVYDQFVSRAIQDANPLPPIPGAMKVSDFTIGLRFTPGQIR